MLLFYFNQNCSTQLISLYYCDLNFGNKQRNAFVTILQSKHDFYISDYLRFMHINYFFSKKIEIFFPKKFGNPNFVRIFN